MHVSCEHCLFWGRLVLIEVVGTAGAVLTAETEEGEEQEDECYGEGGDCDAYFCSH